MKAIISCARLHVDGKVQEVGRRTRFEELVMVRPGSCGSSHMQGGRLDW